MPFYYATKHTDYVCPKCNQDIQVLLYIHSNPSVGCPICNHCLWDDLDIDNSDVPQTISYGQTHMMGLDIESNGNDPRAFFEDTLLTGGLASVGVYCDACAQQHQLDQSKRDKMYNPIKDEWSYLCSAFGPPNPLANKSLNTLMHLDRWIEKQIVIQKNPLNQRYATNPVNPANYANILIRDMVPPSEEPKSTQYGGLSREEWDALKPWQQFKHLDKIKNPSHYYQEGQPLL